jgi:hypothetical protein
MTPPRFGPPKAISIVEARIDSMWINYYCWKKILSIKFTKQKTRYTRLTTEHIPIAYDRNRDNELSVERNIGIKWKEIGIFQQPL